MRLLEQFADNRIAYFIIAFGVEIDLVDGSARRDDQQRLQNALRI